MRPAERWLRRLAEYIETGPSDSGEYRIRCPIHNERNASASANINPEHGPDGVFFCTVCNRGMSLKALVKIVDQKEADEQASHGEGTARYNPFEDDDSNVIDFGSARARRNGTATEREELSEAKVKGWHEALLSSEDHLDALQEKRGLDMRIVEQYRIGWQREKRRYTIPIRDEAGRLVNVRRYAMRPDAKVKIVNATGHGSPPRLYPADQLAAHDTILVVEGEWDALVGVQLVGKQMGVVTGTGGAKKWLPEWSKQLAEKNVFLLYDNDADGRIGAKTAAKSLRHHAACVTILPPLLPDAEKSDLTDWYLQGGTADALVAHVQAGGETTETEQASNEAPTVVPVQVIGSMDSVTNGRTLEMAVTITGRKDPTYSVPRKAHLSCTMDAGPKCKACPMATEWEGEKDVVIGKHEVHVLSEFIDATKDKTRDLLRKYVGAQKCNRLEHDEVENQTIEEIYVMSSVDRQSHEEADYTQRRIYNVGTYDTKTNTVAAVVGTTVPNPKDRRNEFFSWELEEAVTSIDKFKVTPDMVKRLSVFQPDEGQRPLDKCRDIAVDMSSNVTKIMGRERLHMAMDLVWHSLLHFPLDDKVISRGWLEFIVVGDTRTGKSETAIRLADHYRLGHVIGCEGATFAGLVGGVKEISNSRVISWGEITLNDRRLCVLDEASGLSQDIIGQLSDIRSRGMAQITKIESQQTKARCRLIWISNARKSKFVDEKKLDGIDILDDLIGAPEDIARFDFAMSVSMHDVPTSKINNPDRASVPHTYTSDLCNELILWAWSRRADDVQWKPDAYRLVYKMAERLGKTYTDHPPLIQRTNVREKIARISVALAARTFSTDDSGEAVIVTAEHVEDAVDFLNQLYSYDNFGYLRSSKREARNRKIAMENRGKIRKWLRENPRLLEFLLDRRGSFRSQDLEEMAHMHRDEVNQILGRLADSKMISKAKSQIIIEPELHSLLKEMEED